jgi:potassium voltage-gated channel Shab-related subfamily B member 1
MVGERNQDREAVRWELGDSSPPPFNNGGPQYGPIYGGSIQQTTAAVSSSGFGDDGTITTNNGAAAGGSTGKEVRYAPFPVASPTQTNINQQLTQAPLQRTHSRYTSHSQFGTSPSHFFIKLLLMQVNVINTTGTLHDNAFKSAQSSCIDKCWRCET